MMKTKLNATLQTLVISAVILEMGQYLSVVGICGLKLVTYSWNKNSGNPRCVQYHPIKPPCVVDVHNMLIITLMSAGVASKSGCTICVFTDWLLVCCHVSTGHRRSLCLSDAIHDYLVAGAPGFVIKTSLQLGR